MQVLRDRVHVGPVAAGRDGRRRRGVHRAPVRGPRGVRVLAEPLHRGEPRARAAGVAGDDAEPVPRDERAAGHRERRPADTEHAGQLGMGAGLHGRHIPAGVRGTPAPHRVGPPGPDRVPGDGGRERGLLGRPGGTGERGGAAARPRDDGGAERAAGRRVAGAEDVHRVRVPHHMPHVPVVLRVPRGHGPQAGHQQARQLGGVRGVHRVPGPVAGRPVRARVFRRRRGRATGHRHVPAVADPGRVPGRAARVFRVLLPHADANDRRQRGRVAVRQGGPVPRPGARAAGRVRRVRRPVRRAAHPRRPRARARRRVRAPSPRQLQATRRRRRRRRVVRGKDAAPARAGPAARGGRAQPRARGVRTRVEEAVVARRRRLLGQARAPDRRAAGRPVPARQARRRGPRLQVLQRVADPLPAARAVQVPATRRDGGGRGRPQSLLPVQGGPAGRDRVRRDGRVRRRRRRRRRRDGPAAPVPDRGDRGAALSRRGRRRSAAGRLSAVHAGGRRVFLRGGQHVRRARSAAPGQAARPRVRVRPVRAARRLAERAGRGPRSAGTRGQRWHGTGLVDADQDAAGAEALREHGGGQQSLHRARGRTCPGRYIESPRPVRVMPTIRVTMTIYISLRRLYRYNVMMFRRVRSCRFHPR